MDIDTQTIPKKTYIVKLWRVQLKSGASAEFTIREDKGEAFQEGIQDRFGNVTHVWSWPAQKRISRIRDSEIAAVDYQEIEREETALYIPKNIDAKKENHNRKERLEKQLSRKLGVSFPGPESPEV